MKTRRLVLLLLAITITETLGAAILEEPVEYIMIEDPGLANGQIPEYIDGVIRIKRSGSGDFFGYIKKGITSKITQIAQASAGASAHFSKSSSSGSSGGGGGGGGYHYGPPHDDVPSSYDSKSFDFWGLKKSIFNTLIQAVKAIKGGVIAIKGQLIKGGGALISAKGNIISMKGEAISNLGRHIINSAQLSPHQSHHTEEYSAPSAPSGPEVSIHPSTSYGPPKPEYGGPTGHSGPTGGFSDHPPSSGYDAPSNSYGAPSSSYGAPSDSYGPPPSAPSQAYLPQKLNSAYAALRSKIPQGAEAGIVILKKIPSKALDYGHAGIATLPLQDERNKVNHVDLHPPSDVSKPDLPPLFKPLPPNKSPPPSKPDSFFESTLPDIVVPSKLVHDSPLHYHDSAPDAPPSFSGHSAPSAPSAPPSPSGPGLLAGFNGHSAPTLDESLLDASSNNGISNKPFQNYYLGEKPPKEIQNFLHHSGNFNTKIPSPFEINSFNADLQFPNYGLGTFNNVHSPHNSFPSPIQNHFSDHAPSFNQPSGIDSYPLSSHLQYKNGILEHKRSQPNFQVVKSVEYDLSASKRH